MKKRLLSLLLCLVAVLTLLPLPALADGGHSHCICGGDVTAGDHTGHTDVTYQPWNGTSGITYANGAAYVYLTGNATLSGHLTVDGKTLYLCLNGKTLASNGTAKIQVKNGGRLVLCDCAGGGTFKGATQSVWGGACIYLYTSTLDMFGGKLTGGKVTGKGGGGAIALDDQQCIFNMYGGEISGNNGKNYGGAIFRKFNANMPNTTGGTFNMYGGTIKNNTAKNGGGIYINPSNSGQLRVGNKPLVQNNTVSGKANNVYLPSGKTLTIEIDMSKGASIGVTTANIRYPVAFSNSYKKDYANYFFADDANAYVEYKDDQRLYLVSDVPLVTYDVTVETEGGGTASASPETAAADTEITLTAVPAPGYAFDHWEVVKGDVTITDNRFLMPAGAVTVKAVFTAKTFTVYYDPGDGSTPQSRSLGWNDYVLAGVSDPARPGYTFLNWMYGSRPVADNDTYSGLVQSDAVASATLTAAWQLIPYTITYDLDGGTADGNPTGYSVESAAITLVNPTREGYDFTGWSGTGLTGADNLTVVIPAGSTGDRSYTAHWAKQHVHVFDQQMILPQALKTPADCTHDAVYYLSCVCGLVSTDDNQVFTAVGTALGHDWGQPRWQWTGFAAQAVFACSRDAGHVETLTADVASEVTTAPGCVTDGVRTYTATVTLEGRTYTDTKTESIPAAGHDTALKNARAATCTEDGYTGDEVCRTCGETVKQGTVIPATGHDTELKNARAATCTEDGYTGDEVCRTCGETVKQGAVIPATGHDFQDGKCVNCGAADPDYRPAKPENPGVKTGDAGVLLYAGLMLLTLTGSAWVLGRKRTR